MGMKIKIHNNNYNNSSISDKNSNKALNQTKKC